LEIVETAWYYDPRRRSDDCGIKEGEWGQLMARIDEERCLGECQMVGSRAAFTFLRSAMGDVPYN